MSVNFIIFIIINLAVLAFFIESLRRISQRAREYPLEETHESLPFGFLRLRHIVIVYILMYFAWVGFSIWLYTIFIDPSFFSGFSGSLGSNEVFLDL